jgi:hypothetical protein
MTSLTEHAPGVFLIPGADTREARIRAREIKWIIGQLTTDVRRHLAALAELDALTDRVSGSELYSTGRGRPLSAGEYVDWLTSVVVEAADDHVEGGV